MSETTSAELLRPRPQAKRKSSRSWLHNPWVLRVASVAGLLLVWQIFGDKYSTSFPTDIIRSFPHSFTTDVLPALGDTLKGFGAGYAVCVVLGIPIGLLMARSRLVELAIEPYVSALYATPRLALIPVLILWLGIDFKMRFAVVVVSGLFPIILNTYYGAREVDRNLLDAGTAFAAKELQKLRTIVIPASLPYIFAGLRLGMARAFIGIIVAEIETSVARDRQPDQPRRPDAPVLGHVGGDHHARLAEPALLDRAQADRALGDDAVGEAERSTDLAVSGVTGPAPSTQLRPPPPQRAPFLYRKSGMWTVRIVTLALILGFWQWWAEGRQRAIAATPHEFANAVYRQLVTDHTFYGPLWSSLEAFILGVMISLLLGIPIGIAMGRWRSAEHTIDPYVSFLYALPHVAFVPIMIVWLGFQLEFRLAYVVLSAIFPVIINTMTGVKNVDEQLLDAGRSFCADEKLLVRTVVLPAASPYIVAGARQAMSAAWVGVVVAEVLSTQTGLGGLINHYSDYFLTADMYVPILGIMVIAVTIQAVAGYFQNRLTPWTNAAQRERAGG